MGKTLFLRSGGEPLILTEEQREERKKGKCSVPLIFCRFLNYQLIDQRALLHVYFLLETPILFFLKRFNNVNLLLAQNIYFVIPLGFTISDVLVLTTEVVRVYGIHK